MSEELCLAEQELRQKPELLSPHESYFTPLGSRYSVELTVKDAKAPPDLDFAYRFHFMPLGSRYSDCQ